MKCPYCGGRNPDEAVRCAHCGEQLNTNSAGKESIRPRDENFKIRPVFSNMQKTRETAEQNRQKGWVILLIIGASVVCAVASVLIFSYMRQNQKTSVTTAATTVEEVNPLIITKPTESEEVMTGMTIDEKTKAETPGDTITAESTDETEQETEPVTAVQETIPESTTEAATENTSEPDTYEFGGMIFLVENQKAVLYRNWSQDSTVYVKGGEGIAALPVVGIGERAFSDREGYSGYTQKVVLPEGLVWIGNEAFSDCPTLTEVYIPASVTDINPTAFQNCSAKIITPEGSAAWNYAVSNGIAVEAGNGVTE